jgi:hypothetical protein
MGIVLLELNKATIKPTRRAGATTTRISFDSNMFPQAAGAQLQGAGTACGSGSFFNFTANAYYLDVEITKTGISGTPVLEGVNVCLSIC